jgi:hypothetical protein
MKNKNNGWVGTLAYWLTGLTAEAVISGALKAPVSGRKYFAKLDWTKPVMIVTTHLSDSDIQLAAYRLHKTLGLDLVVTNQSTQHQGRDFLSLGTTVFVKTLGRGRFSPMGWRWGERGRPVPAFRGEDFWKIKQEVFEKRRTLLIAGHNPTSDGILPKKPGLGAAMVAEMADGVQIVPVGVVVKGQAPNAYQMWEALSGRWGRSAKVVVGEPFSLGRKLDDREVEILLDQDRVGAEEYKLRVTQSAGEIMYKLAELLPAEKRGIWDQKPSGF